MQEKSHKGRRRVPPKFLRAVAFCIACVIINTIGSQVATLLHLPIYLDSWGTVFAAMIGGFVPGIVVGYVTNLFNTIYDSTFMYYGIVSVLIAITTTILAQRGWFQKLSRTLLAILILGVLSGLLSSLVSFLLYGGNVGDSASNPFAQQLYVLGPFDLLTSQVLGQLFVNLVDKAFVVLSATLAYHMVPDAFLDKLDDRIPPEGRIVIAALDVQAVAHGDADGFLVRRDDMMRVFEPSHTAPVGPGIAL